MIFAVLLLSVLFLLVASMEIYHYRKMTRQLEKFEADLKITGGPFIATSIRFPRRMKRYQFTRDLLSQLHIHHMTPRRVEHLVHIIKNISPDIPASAMIYKADIEMSRDVWTITLADESFDVVEDGDEIPIGTISLVTDLLRRAGPETECADCLADRMSPNKKTPF